MSKDKKLYFLRNRISVEASRVSVMLDLIYDNTDDEYKVSTIIGLLLEKSKRIEKMSEKIGKILKH